MLSFLLLRGHNWWKYTSGVEDVDPPIRSAVDFQIGRGMQERCYVRFAPYEVSLYINVINQFRLQ